MLPTSARIGTKKKGAGAPFRISLRLLFAVTLAKFINLFCGLQYVLFAGVKRMRLAGDFQL